MKLGETRNGDPQHPLAAARLRKGWSIRKLAEEVAMTHVGISHIETGRAEPRRFTKRLLEMELGPIDWPEPSKNGSKR